MVDWLRFPAAELTSRPSRSSSSCMLLSCDGGFGHCLLLWYSEVWSLNFWSNHEN